MSTVAMLDQQRAEAFGTLLLSVLNDGALCLMISVGHRTGLFDTMRDLQPMTSEELAQQAGLNERYVREWLGAMLTSGVIEFDVSTGRFFLPPEHAGYLTRAAGSDNIGVFAQYISALGAVEDDIVECFRKGGGVPYSKFPRFHDVMEEDSGQSVLSCLETQILPLVPGLNDQLARGIRLLDLGCGRGRILARLAELYPNSSFLGMDLSQAAIDYARGIVSDKRLSNVGFLSRDLSHFDSWAVPESYDFVTTFDAVHDQAQPLRVLKGIYRALKTDGTSDAGHQRLERDAEERLASARNLPVHDFVHALHHGFPCPGWRGIGCDVG